MMVPVVGCARVLAPVVLVASMASPSLAIAATCATIGSSKSPGSNVPTSITFVNRGADTRIVVWMGFDGKPNNFGALGPGQSKTVNTFVGHIWAVAYANGACAKVAAATARPSTVQMNDAVAGGGPRTTPVAPGNPVTPGGVSAAVRSAILSAHNARRTNYCVPKLTWSAQLAAGAQAWAARCNFAHSGAGTGENIAMGTNLGAGQAVALWFSEKANYNYASPGFSPNTGHFTQIVWKGSTQLGCGVAACPSGQFYVCRYMAPGNVAGQYPQNVLKPCK